VNEREIFDNALAIVAPGERERYLDEMCAGNERLRGHIEGLILAHEDLGSFLESPPVSGSSPTIHQHVTEKPGTVIGPYKLLQQIGEGGMGVVYMAEQTEPVSRRVALKIIKPGMDSRQVIARFEAERQALAMMDHPNIAKVFDAGTTDTGRPYFVMELVKGLPITQYCDEHQLSPRARLELFLPACQAVQHAHQKGIIHRDIKPSNVMVADYDDRPVPKIIDFGVAKAVEQRLTEKTLFTEFGQVVGTMEYMSPEQAKLNQQDIDTRSDIYSLGVLLYELLAGETPFDRERLRSAVFDELLRIIREEEPPRPSQRLSTSQSLPSIAANRQIEPKKLSTLVHGELDWIVMKALEKDRTRRYETANSFAADVQHYLTDEPVEACPPSAVYRLKKFARRNRAAITTAVFIGAALLLGTVISTWQAIRATKAEALASQRLVAERQARDQAQRERDRAESNLDLALKALDEVYLGAIEEDALLAQPVSAAEVDDSSDVQLQTLSEMEREWVDRGLEFYDQFAIQNDSVTAAASDAARAYHRVGVFQASLGSLASAEKAYRAAIQRFERLTNEQPDNSTYLSALGDAYRGLAFVLPEWSAATEAFVESFQAYSRGIEVSPNDYSLYSGRASTAWQLRDGQQATEDFEKAAQLAPDNIEVLLACSHFYKWGPTLFRDTEKTLHYAERAVDLAPDNAECHRQLAHVHAGLSHTDRALEHYARSIQLNPHLPLTYIQRGLLYSQLGEEELYLADMNRGLELPSNDGRIKGLLYYFRAYVYATRQEYDKALADLAAATQLRPTMPHAWFLTGEYRYYLGDYQAALVALNQAIEIRPRDSDYYKWRAKAHFQLEQYDKALTDLKTALELNPTDTNALCCISPPLVATCPDESFREHLLELADTAVEKSDAPARARFDRIDLYLGLNKLDKARTDFSDVLTGDTIQHYDHYRHALLYLVFDDAPKYRDACAVMVQKYAASNDPMAANFVAWTCALAPDAVEDYEPVLTSATKAVDAQTDSDFFLGTLGAVDYRAGRYEDAVERLTVLDRRLENPDYHDLFSPAYTWYFLAMVHKKGGNEAHARQYLNKANEWTADVFGDEKNLPVWDRRATWELLRKEAEALLGTDDQESADNDQKPKWE